MKMSRLEKMLVNGTSHSRRVAAHAVARLSGLGLPDGATYLDAGCGNGAAATEIATKRGLTVTGVDIDPAQIAIARLRACGGPRAEFLVADARALPFDDATFDVVATNKMLHHVDDWERTLRELIRVLRVKGHLLVADLVAPAPVAPLLTALLRRRVPTADRVCHDVIALGMSALRTDRSLWTLDAAWRRDR